MNKFLYAILLALAFTTQGCISDKEPEGPSLQVGDSLPFFTISLNDGEFVSTETIKGKVPVIIFFNTGCGDCRKELPVIEDIWNFYMDNSIVKILPISREESAEEIEEYWKKEGFTMPYSAQENRDIYSLFAQSVIPRIYIANKDGIITASYGDSDMPDFNTLIESISLAGDQSAKE